MVPLFSYMAKKAPRGLGIWIAFEEMNTPGTAVHNTIKRAKEIGAKWVAVRGGGNRKDGRLVRDIGLPVGAIREYKDAGFDVYVWVFSYPDEQLRRDEIALYKDFVAEGADGLIVNAEVAWKVKDCDALAARHVRDIRAAVGDVWVAHAPFALPMSHRDFPYVGFHGLDAVLAQLYWTEFSDSGLKPWLDRYHKEWEQYWKAHPELVPQPVHPIGVTYGKELGKKWGLKQAPPGVFKASDLELFLDHFSGDRAPSLYTLEAMNDEARAVLVARAAREGESVTETKEVKAKVPEAHLPASGKTLRANDWGQAFRLTEAPPNFDGSVKSVLDIVSWLGVEKNGRWRPKSGATYCNVYAHDLCGAIGAYVPRVWWTKAALKKLECGEDVRPTYAVTVCELSANDLYRWFVDWGPSFGWRRVKTLDEAQALANAGHAAVICARNRVESASGHISVIVGESDRLAAKRDFSGAVVLPVQSQAGGKCYELSHISAWWTSSTFAEFGFWVHDPKSLDDGKSWEIDEAIVEEHEQTPETGDSTDSGMSEDDKTDTVTTDLVVHKQPGGFFAVLLSFITNLIAVIFGKK